MRIIKEDQGSIVVKDNAVVIILISVIFIAVGLSFGISGGGEITATGIFIPIEHFLTAIVGPGWLGYAFALVGLSILFFAKITTITVDKMTGKLRFDKIGLTGKKSQEYDISQIQRMELNEIIGDKGSRSYEIMFVMKNNERLPFNVSRAKIAIGGKIAAFINVPFEERRSPTIKDMFSGISGIINKNKNTNSNDLSKPNYPTNGPTL